MRDVLGGHHSYPCSSRRRECYDSDSYRKALYETIAPGEKNVAILRDKALKDAGDLGWTVEYATAWCYKHLIGNRPAVTDAIDRVRELEDVEVRTPFIVFDFLDKALFGHKLKGMVYMRWTSFNSCSPGMTSAPGVVSGISRICIELNKTLFEDDDGDIDDMLDVLIHQMIHAFFLVACGAQPKGAKQDGRLMDGLHFGVILSTIRDITDRCMDGMLNLIFYFATRAGYNRHRDDRRRFIALDPRGSAVGPAPADGQSHCTHDNRQIRPAHLKNWQVETYASALESDLQSKGDVIYDLGTDSKLEATDRLKGPPSSTYVELIWDDKRVMVPREKALKYKSIKKPLEKEDKMELKVPECTTEVFVQIYNFFTIGSTLKDMDQVLVEQANRMIQTKGPPVLVTNGHGRAATDSPVGLINHLQVFKVAEGMKFEELQQHVLQRLWEMPTTFDDPIKALKLLYNDKDNSGPVHSELHKWARSFLCKRDDGGQVDWYHGSRAGWYDNGWPGWPPHSHSGLSNYEKILQFHTEDFRSLYHRNLALKDDCKLVIGLMSQEMTDVNDIYGLPQPEFPQPINNNNLPLLLRQANVYPEVTDTVLQKAQRRVRPQRARSWDDDPLGARRNDPFGLGAPAWHPHKALWEKAALDDALLPRHQPALGWLGAQPLGLPRTPAVSCRNVFNHRRGNMLTC